MARSNEAFWWSLFSAGGVMAAMFIPVFILLTGFVLPFMSGENAIDRHEHLSPILSFWVTRVVLAGIIVLCFFHCAHRIRHVLHDVGVHADKLLAIVCYAVAIAGSAATVIVVLF